MSRQNADKQIRDMLEKYGEEFNEGTVWRVQGNPVIGHKTLERIAARAGIWFDAPTIVRAERDEAVILVMGHMGDDSAAGIRDEWSIGEALIDVNYRVSGRQAAYVWAMAEKRAKDRVILKLVNLHGLLYSEEEADEFKEERPRGQTAKPKADAPATDSGPYKTAAGYERRPGPRLAGDSDVKAIVDALVENARQHATPPKLDTWAQGQKSAIDTLPDDAYDYFIGEFLAHRRSLAPARSA